MPLYLVTAPPVEPITVEDAKLHARIDHVDDDTHLGSLIAAARQAVEGRDGLLGRALVLQTWDWKIDRFDRYRPEGAWTVIDAAETLCRAGRRRLELPLPPHQSVVSVKYLDEKGIEQTLSSSSYVVTGLNGWQPAQLEPATGATWPATLAQPEAIRIRLQCGYAPDNLVTPTDYVLNIPESIKLALKIMVAAWYENRAPVGVMPDGAYGLLVNYRTRFFA